MKNSTDPTPPNMSVDEKPHVNQFAVIIFSELFNNEGMTDVGKVEKMMPHISALLDTFAEKLIGSNKTLPKYMTDWQAGDNERYWYNRCKDQQRARIPELKKEMGL